MRSIWHIGASIRAEEERTMRIVVFGANGPTGRLLAARAAAAGHEAVAVTRHPGTFPLRDAGVQVVRGDVLDADAVDGIVEGSDAVLSALGVPFGKTPVETYSRGTGHLIAAMKRHGVRRLVVLSSGAVTGEDEPTGGFVFNRVLQPYVRNKLGRTVYDDMRRMEDAVSTSDLDWTILRPSGLYDLPEVTDYSLTEEHGVGRFTSRLDLADAMLRQIDDSRFLRRVGHVITRHANPSLLSMMLREAFKK
jgi:nucleoside-diphosphate-sugar epimerase